MESIHKTYAYSIQPVPSQEFWTRSEYSRPDPPIIKRPIGRPKVHNRQKDPAEPMMQQGAKLKRSFKVTCSKCGSEGHNYKTYKGAPSNPNWKPKTKKSKKGGTSQSLVVLPLSQSAPQDDDAPNTQSAPSSEAATSHAASSQAPDRCCCWLLGEGFVAVGLEGKNQVPTTVPATPNPITPTPVADQPQPGRVTRRTLFRPPLQVPSTTHETVQPKTSKIRPKQKIFRPPAPICATSLPPPSQPAPPQPQPSQVRPGPSTVASKETMAAASTATTRLLKFIPNPPSINPKT
ncbi:predicted GPI-anchored protein 58 [Arachis ipaensis]|uniref:predicted GPI-anchored protein 58 n=1 Tax=Arachis ipaensis TaxID=130454 RepID=UPI0007AF4132|nr:predicted GPI-anchored protein 58 [Arachis ipaensis]